MNVIQFKTDNVNEWWLLANADETDSRMKQLSSAPRILVFTLVRSVLDIDYSQRNFLCHIC